MVRNYTVQWDDDNWDFFERNILTYRCGTTYGTSVTDEFDTPFDAGEPMVCWPEYEDVIDWAKSNQHAKATGRDTGKSKALQMALDGAVRLIARRSGYRVLPEDPTEDHVMIPADLRLAATMQAAKWYFRKDSPNGIVGADAVNGSIRAGRFDPDVEEILHDYDPVGLG